MEHSYHLHPSVSRSQHVPMGEVRPQGKASRDPCSRKLSGRSISKALTMCSVDVIHCSGRSNLLADQLEYEVL